MHEYTVIGHPREKIILIIAILSFGISNFITYITQEWLKDHFNIVLSFTISVFTVFTILYLLFNKFLWKLKIFGKLLNFPDLNGEWECKGAGTNLEQQKQNQWEGTVVIKQTWDKMLVSVRTKTSTSQSISLIGGIRHYPGVGYQMSYHYENMPSVSIKDLKKHDGFCMLTFNEDKSSARGSYFNNIKDRASYGEMILERSQDDAQLRLLKEA